LLLRLTKGVEMRAGVEEMRGARIENIREIIFPLIEGKKLLDIGCIGHNFEERRSMGTFYIEDFQKKAASAKGIDILVDDVKRAQARGVQR
jgi:hypothetical protein